MATTNQLGLLFECLICGDFFVLIAKQFANSGDLLEVQQAAQKARCSGGGRKGKSKRNKRKKERNACKEALADLLVEVQEKWHRQTWTGCREHPSRLSSCSRCPSCTERVYEMDYQSWVEQPELNPVFSLCKVVVFDEGDGTTAGEEQDGVPLGSGALPPIYLNRKATGKPKWKLCQGIGPATLEMDRSQSNRVWRPSLAQFGLCGTEPTASRFSFADSSSTTDVAIDTDTGNTTKKSEASIKYLQVLEASRRAAEHFQVLGPQPPSAVVASTAGTDTGSKSKRGVTTSAKGVSTVENDNNVDDDLLLDQLFFGFGAGAGVGVAPLPTESSKALKRTMATMKVTKSKVLRTTSVGVQALSVFKKYTPLCNEGAWEACAKELRFVDEVHECTEDN